jgi:hypothetical protein
MGLHRIAGGLLELSGGNPAEFVGLSNDFDLRLHGIISPWQSALSIQQATI